MSKRVVPLNSQSSHHWRVVQSYLQSIKNLLKENNIMNSPALVLQSIAFLHVHFALDYGIEGKKQKYPR